MIQTQRIINLNGLASDLINLYNDDLSSNMEIDTDVNMSDFVLQNKYESIGFGNDC